MKLIISLQWIVLPWLPILILFPHRTLVKLTIFFIFMLVLYILRKQNRIIYLGLFSIFYLMSVLWILFERKYQIPLTTSLFFYGHENLALLDENIFDFLVAIPAGFLLSFIISILAILMLKFHRHHLAMLCYIFSITLLFLAPGPTSKSIKKVSKASSEKSNPLSLPFVGKLPKDIDVIIFLLEGVSENHLTDISLNRFKKGASNWYFDFFYVPIPHSSKSIFTLLTSKLQTNETRPNLSGFPATESLPKVFEKWGYYTAFYSSQPIVIENIDQIAREYFLHHEDKSTLKKKFSNYSEFSWGLDDQVLFDQIENDLHRNNPLFLLLGFSNTHSPYFISENNKYSNPTEKNSYFRFKAALNYDMEIIENIVSLIEKERDRETLFILLSDHGESFGERNFNHHNYSLFNAETNVPLIFIYTKDNISRHFKSGSLQDFKWSILSLFDSTKPTLFEDTNFFQPNYNLSLPLKSWNSDSYLGLVDRESKWIFYKDSNRLFQLDLAETKEIELTLPKEKKDFMLRYYKRLNLEN